MAIRFIDTNFYKSTFVRGLEGALKGLYGFIICDCSAAGIWGKDLEIASIYIGFKISESEFEKNFVAKGKAIFLGNGKYFFPDFIQHQYPKGLQKTNPAHQNIIAELLKYSLIDKESLKVLQSPLEGAISNSKGNSNGNSESKSKETREEKISDVEIIELFEIEILTPEFERYQDWAARNFPDLLKFDQPLTDQQLQALFDQFKNKTLVREKLEAIGNTKNAKKKYSTVYATCRNWCKLALDRGWKDPTEPSAIGQDVWSKNLNDLRKMRESRENNNLKLTQ
jgi:hypothetical protein